MTALVTTPSLESRSDPGDPGHTVERGFDHRVFLTYNASVMAVATVVVVTNWSEPAAVALGAIMFAMSAFLLLMCGIERLGGRAMAFLSRRMRVSSMLMVGISSLALGIVSGLLVSDGLDGLLGRDALAASRQSSDGSEAGAFWEQRMFHAMMTGDRTLFARACDSLTTLQIRPGICAGGGATAD
jgi:hypothetical protein